MDGKAGEGNATHRQKGLFPGAHITYRSQEWTTQIQNTTTRQESPKCHPNIRCRYSGLPFYGLQFNQCFDCVWITHHIASCSESSFNAVGGLQSQWPGNISILCQPGNSSRVVKWPGTCVCVSFLKFQKGSDWWFHPFQKNNSHSDA